MLMVGVMSGIRKFSSVRWVMLSILLLSQGILLSSCGSFPIWVDLDPETFKPFRSNVIFNEQRRLWGDIPLAPMKGEFPPPRISLLARGARIKISGDAALNVTPAKKGEAIVKIFVAKGNSRGACEDNEVYRKENQVGSIKMPINSNQSLDLEGELSKGAVAGVRRGLICVGFMVNVVPPGKSYVKEIGFGWTTRAIRVGLRIF